MIDWFLRPLASLYFFSICLLCMLTSILLCTSVLPSFSPLFHNGHFKEKTEMSIKSFLVKFDLKFWILSSLKSQVYKKCFLFIISFGFFCTFNYCTAKVSDSHRVTNVPLCVNIFAIVNTQSSVAINEPYILWFDSRCIIITGMLVK